MPRERAIEGWPDHWYNQQGYIPCPAHGYTKLFDSGNIRWRGHHWYDRDPASPSYNDHAILLAIHRQIDCAHCDYHNDLSLKELLAHEQARHGSSHMSTMQGYLCMMRQGLDTDEARVCRGAAYQRLMQNIWDSPYRNRLLSRVYPQMLPHEARMRRDLLPILAHQNLQAGRPIITVILARDFLTHLRPTPGDQSAWPATYRELRARMGKDKKKDKGKQMEADMEKNEETNKGKEKEKNEEEGEEEMEDEKEKRPMKYVEWREIERMKDKDKDKQMRKLAGFQHGTNAMLGFPEHWYDNDCNIPCPATDCSMLFNRRKIHQLGLHWENVVTPDGPPPPMTALTHAEHGILYHMLVQMTCPYCDYGTVYGPRQIFDHEARQHHSSNTSRLTGVISLARQGGHYELAHPAIFKRMVLKIWDNGHLRRSVLRRAHNGHVVMDPKEEDLASALFPPDHHPGVAGAPVRTAVRHRDFLMHLSPTHAYSGLDPFWKGTWEDLRLRYISGEI
ncbi:MAG: hypothetical protein ASARMPRED_008136 [Alectoria sarmentosa]|nr:MAG: hypothetical protein ASARMPRED_008136 [Alectoria sarmentosa]